MRLINLHYNDIELFHCGFTEENVKYFHTHNGVFESMWIEQGKVFWLRFLVTFKTVFYACDDQVKELTPIIKKICSVLFILIHKHFIEKEVTTAKTFIYNLLIIVNYYQKTLNSVEIDFTQASNPNVEEAFKSIFGLCDLNELQDDQYFWVFYTFMNFYGAVAYVLRKWTGLCDLTKEEVEEIDNKLVYWMPNWNEELFQATCFERYLADHYKAKLPRFLLTSNIHNLYYRHPKGECCELYKNKTVFLKFLAAGSRSNFYATQFMIPNVAFCKTHPNCKLKITHSINCMQPFLCDGNSSCIVRCEKELRSEKVQQKSLKGDKFWKSFLVEVYSCKNKKRTVSTLAETHFKNIETYLHSKKLWDDHSSDFNDRKFYNNLFVPSHAMINYCHQIEKRVEIKNRLKRKYFDKLGSYWLLKDHLEITTGKMEASTCQASLHDIASEWLKNHSFLDKGCEKYCEELKKYANTDVLKNKENVLNNSAISLTTVAIGTRDVVYGRVIRSFPKVYNNASDKTTSCPVAKSSEKNSKSKKKRSKNKKENSERNVNSQFNDKQMGNNTTAIECKNDSELSVVKNKELYPNTCSQSSDEKVGVAPGISINDNNCSIKNSAENQKEAIQDWLELFEDSCGDSDSILESPKELIKDCNLWDGKTEAQNYVANASDPREKGNDVAGKSVLAYDKIDKIYSSGIKEVAYSCSEISEEICCPKDPEEKHYTKESDSNSAVENFLTLIRGNSKALSCESEKPVLTKPLKVSSEAKVKNGKKGKLKSCAYCQTLESQRRTYKVCAQCIEEQFLEKRYYCSPGCQEDDWEERHRDEHLNKGQNMLANIL